MPTGAVAISLYSIQVSAGGVQVYGDVSITLPAITLSIDGITGELGTCEITLPSLDIYSIGSQELNDVNITIPKIVVSSTGGAAILGSCEISLPAITLDSGTNYIYGDASISFPSIRSSGVAYNSVVGTCYISIPIIGVSSTGMQRAVGDVTIELPMISLAASGRQELITAHVDIDSSTDKTYVMNISNRSITEYINFNFNSYCRFNGVYFGAKADGIYLLGGNTGETTLIKSQVRFPAYNIQKPSVQRPREVWATFRSNGQITLTVRLGEDETWENIFPIVSDYIDEARVILAKGFKTSTYEFGIKNVGGSNFDLESVRVMIDDIRSGKE